MSIRTHIAKVRQHCTRQKHCVMIGIFVSVGAAVMGYEAFAMVTSLLTNAFWVYEV